VQEVCTLTYRDNPIGEQTLFFQIVIAGLKEAREMVAGVEWDMSRWRVM
jgi:hypothetical protein